MTQRVTSTGCQGEKGKSGVTVIDSEEHKVVAQIPTGAGHHEIAFSDDSLYAFITNREEGTLSIIDVQKLKKIKDINAEGSLFRKLTWKSMLKNSVTSVSYFSQVQKLFLY